MMKTTIFLAVLFGVTAAWMGCSSDSTSTTPAADSGSLTDLEPSSPYPDCQSIIDACHEKDISEGPAHDCHEIAHGAKSNADCAPKKTECIATCNAVDAGHDETDAGDAGHHHDEDAGDGG